MERYPDYFGELSSIGVLPSRDSEIRGAIVRIAKTNIILKRLVNKFFPIENTYQDTNQTGTEREQKLRRKCKSRLSEYDEWRVSELSHDGGPYHIETSPLIWRVNERTGFYTTGTLVNALLLVCIHQDIFLDYETK